MSNITTMEQLEAIYGRPNERCGPMSDDRVGGEDYDRAWPERARQTLW